MAKQLVSYLLEGNDKRPDFIEIGGFITNSTTEECIGRSVDETKRHVPITVVRLTRADLKLRMQTLSYNIKFDGTTMTDAELDSHIQTFLDSIDMGDLA